MKGKYIPFTGNFSPLKSKCSYPGVLTIKCLSLCTFIDSSYSPQCGNQLFTWNMQSLQWLCAFICRDVWEIGSKIKIAVTPNRWVGYRECFHPQNNDKVFGSFLLYFDDRVWPFDKVGRRIPLSLCPCIKVHTSPWGREWAESSLWPGRIYEAKDRAELSMRAPLRES